MLRIADHESFVLVLPFRGKMVQLILMHNEILDNAKKIHETFANKGLTLSAAESCTGGLISHFLTGMPGASDFFLGGIICYANMVKRDVLGVSSDTISRHGAVSKETALEMADKARKLMRSDYAVSVTGNLGPGSLEGKNRGLIYLAVSTQGRNETRELRLSGGRDENRHKATLELLRCLLAFIEEAGTQR